MTENTSVSRDVLLANEEAKHDTRYKEHKTTESGKTFSFLKYMFFSRKVAKKTCEIFRT